MQKFVLSSLVAAASIASTSSAGIIVFTNEFVWDSFATGNDAAQFTETFESYNGFYASPLTGSTGGVNWSANATGGLYVGAVGTSKALSTNNPAPMTITFSGEAVRGIAGNIFGTDINFNIVPSIVQVTLSNGASFIGFTSSANDFIGFYSTDAAITSMTITKTGTGAGAVFPTVDNLYFAVPIPAPGAAALIGLLVSGRRVRR